MIWSIYKEYIESIPTVSAEVNIYESLPFEEDSKVATLDEEAILKLSEQLPVMDGATALSSLIPPLPKRFILKIVGAESLIRWNHPEYGLVPPGKFIPVAEESGLIGPIGEWMMKKVCKQLAVWKKNGFSLIPVSINITSKSFLKQGFAEGIRKLLKHYDLEGKWLEIEITENSIMRNEEMVQKTLKELKEMGVKIYIDDFGTGYSSFNYLKTFRLDGVKIDQSFVRNIANNPENASITSAMIKVAQQLNLEVIAEGVETREELDFLLSLNCRYIQGYYFAKPCLIEEFEKNYLEIMK
ncbi:putative bifunctional diguanylate cyclase/phosphodiesterase [Ureibacillus thermophilus]|uniref:EAL domain-containing protein n=1 Tax=Ureibacillus thermophilus TaxID=367743 RepID=A0A4P6UTN7_9BACL|nr:EAL domain-containing protein [Ureibacillus thermophilus]QBK25905.1 EAL domain-containing protein [Ureibacillus thermophilus]